MKMPTLHVWHLLIPVLIAGFGAVISITRVFAPTASVLIDMQAPSPAIMIETFRSYDGRILLDLHTESGHDLYLIQPSSRRISIPNRSSIVSFMGVRMSKESSFEGVSFHKAEIPFPPIWKEKSLEFVGLRGRKIEMHWLF